jgi:subtilisin-like proprotein convertase family protein
MFSNRAAPGITINNVTSGGLCSIQDKTSTVKYNNEILLSNFNSLFNTSSIGNWSLIIVDNDIGISGLIESWKLIVTYKPEPDQE